MLGVMESKVYAPENQGEKVTGDNGSDFRWTNIRVMLEASFLLQAQCWIEKGFLLNDIFSTRKCGITIGVIEN